MKYNLIGSNNILTPLKTVLQNRGIEDIPAFLSVGRNKNVTNHYSKLNNIDKAVDCLLKHIEANNKIYVQVDSDADGYMSAATLIQYLQKINPKIDLHWGLHQGKEHGINIDDIPLGVNLVIIPDAGSSQFLEHKKLHDQAVDVIVLDHHKAEKESEHAIVVNNQLSPEFSNNEFSGVGIVFKFLEALDDRLEVKYADNYLDMVALGNIGDLMNTRELETRYYILKGLKKLRNPLIKALFKAQEFSTKGKINITTASWFVIPLVNAIIRSGNQKEKEQTFKTFLDDGTTEVYYERGKKYEPLIDNTIRMMKRVRVRQNKLRDEGVELIKERIEEKNLLDNKVLIVNVSDILEASFSGLVANRLADRYKRPVLLPRFDENTGMYSGSARGYEKGAIKDFRQYLDETDKFIYVQGHDNAFGFSIDGVNLVEVNKQINEDLKDVDIDVGSYDVDFVLKASQVQKSFISELDAHKDVWGRGVEEPLIYIKDIEVSKSNVRLIGKNKSTIKFTSNGIEYIKFFSSEEEYNNIMNKGSSVDQLKFTVVGHASINEFRGRETGQIVIEDLVVDVAQNKLPF